jgi:hypothetical protein
MRECLERMVQDSQGSRRDRTDSWCHDLARANHFDKQTSPAQNVGHNHKPDRMKAKTQSTETITAPGVDPTVISTLTDLASRLSSARIDHEKHQKKGHDLHIFCERFLRNRDGHFDPKEFAEALIEGCKSPGSRRHDIFELRGAMEKREAEYAQADKLSKEIAALEAELRELLKREGSAFDAQILAAHKALVAEVSERIRPECTDDEEAHLVAQGMNRPSLLHGKLYSWKRGEDLEIRVSNFLEVLNAGISE